MRNVAKLNLQYFAHVVCGSAGQLSLAVLTGMVDGIRHQGYPRRCWINEVLEWRGNIYKELKAIAQDWQI